MASIPGARFDITGATGSQGVLSPQSGWRAYALPRGGYASQSSTGTLITFDSASVASRFAANNWIQAGLSVANVRQVAAVGGNSLSISGAALTISENDRIYLIGTTEPTVTGGSATYTPATTIRQRDDDGSDQFTNSMVTTTADGTIQFFAAPNFYDVLVQDANRTLQGSIIDLPVGNVGGISTDTDALFGMSVTVNGAIGVTGWATFGSTATFNAAIGVTGWATFGATVTMNAALGVTGVATLSGRAAFGNSASIDGALGITGSVIGRSDAYFRRFHASAASGVTNSDFNITTLGRWGSTASVSVAAGSVDQAGEMTVTANGATFEFAPLTTFTFRDGSWGTGSRVRGVIACTRVNDYEPIGILVTSTSATSISWATGVTPSATQQYRFTWSLFGVT